MTENMPSPEILQDLDDQRIEDLDAEEPSASWLDAASLETDDVEVDEFDIVSSPNDWNFSTIVDFIDAGAIKIPAFQRNYVWDIKRASKLIESLLLGLPVPQVFLYERRRNDFIVIDGQQRLLTLYFYKKGRFPRPRTRGALRPALTDGRLDQELLDSDDLFAPFKLSLPSRPGRLKSRYHQKTYLGLGEDRTGLDLRTLRNVVVKQTHPEGDSAVFEIFNRLNTGGVNLSPQEIRASLYNSELIRRVLDFNRSEDWRHIVGRPEPDPRMKDSEFLLRGLAIARGIDTFSGSLTNFVNAFCEQARSFDGDQINQAVSSLETFTAKFSEQPADTFERNKGKFSGVLFESAFAGWVRIESPDISGEAMAKIIQEVKEGEEFSGSLQEGSTKPANIKTRTRLFESAFRPAGG